LYYAASGIITPKGGLPVHRLRVDQSSLSLVFEAVRLGTNERCSNSSLRKLARIKSSKFY